MSQCVPSWELDDAANHDPPPPPPPRLPFNGARDNSNTKHADTQLPPEETMLDYQVAELTWENGQLAMHGLGPPRPVKPAASSKYTWDKPSGGTLESIVNQATGLPPPGKTTPTPTPAPPSDDLLPWFHHHRAAAGAATLTMDALVPSAWAAADSTDEQYSDRVPDTAVGSSTRVESCSAARKDVPDTACGGGGGGGGVRNKRNKTALSGVFDGNSWNRSESTTRSRGRQVTMDDTCEIDLSSQENTSYGKPLSSDSKLAATTLDDHDSVSHSRNEREAGNGNEKKVNTARSSVSTKRSRAAAIHNQSERKRRDRINQRMKTLQKLVPNSSKTDKASMLDEVIEYLKQLQAQIQMMNKMSSFSQMMMPMGMQQLQMAMMAQMGMGLGMGMGVMDMNAAITRQPQTAAGMASLLHPAAAAAFLAVPTQWDTSAAAAAAAPTVVPDPFAAFLACQTQPQPMTLDAYNRMAAMCQQLHQHQPSVAAAAAAAAAATATAATHPHSRAS